MRNLVRIVVERAGLDLYVIAVAIPLMVLYTKTGGRAFASGRRVPGSVKSSFTAHPDPYVVRMVVRDTEGQMPAAPGSLVEIR